MDIDNKYMVILFNNLKKYQFKDGLMSFHKRLLNFRKNKISKETLLRF